MGLNKIISCYPSAALIADFVQCISADTAPVVAEATETRVAGSGIEHGNMDYLLSLC